MITQIRFCDPCLYNEYSAIFMSESDFLYEMVMSHFSCSDHILLYFNLGNFEVEIN